jgi:hypothetical protein
VVKYELRRIRCSTFARTQLPTSTARSLTAPRLLGLKQYKRTITAVGAKQASVSRHWFTSSSPCSYPEPDEREKERLNERNLKMSCGRGEIRSVGRRS